jgi:hypothetical protein
MRVEASIPARERMKASLMTRKGTLPVFGIALSIFYRGIMNGSVTRWKAVLVLMFLALWASCTLCCHASFLCHSTSAACCDDAGEESNQVPAQSGHCICGILGSSGFLSEKSVIPIPLPDDILSVSVAPPQAGGFLRIPVPVQPVFSPPEFIKGWQFFHRAAASPRAPASAS